MRLKTLKTAVVITASAIMLMAASLVACAEEEAYFPKPVLNSSCTNVNCKGTVMVKHPVSGLDICYCVPETWTVSVDEYRTAVEKYLQKENAKDAKSTGDMLIVATNNIDAKAQPDVDAQRAFLESYGVQIVGLQEVDNNTRRNPYDVVEKFKEEPYKDAYFSSAIPFSGGDYGIATVSQIPFKSQDTTRLYSDLFAGEEIADELKAAYVDYDPDNEASEAAMDAVSAKNPIEPRVFQRVVVDVNGKDVAFYNTHLSWENRSLREQQMQALKSAMENDSCKYVVAVGDYNADQSTEEFNIFTDKYSIANGKDGKWLDTFNGVDDTMQVMSVDNIIVSQNIKIMDVKMVESGLSDHNPLIATLVLE